MNKELIEQLAISGHTAATTAARVLFGKTLRTWEQEDESTRELFRKALLDLAYPRGAQ